MDTLLKLKKVGKAKGSVEQSLDLLRQQAMEDLDMNLNSSEDAASGIVNYI